MSVERPQSTRVFLTMQLAISTLITIGSSYIGLIVLKSFVVKVMSGMLGTRCQEIMLTDQTCRRFLFRAEAVAPPPTKPLAMVFITHPGWSRVLSSLSLEQLWLLRLFDWPACSQSLPHLNSGLFLFRPLRLWLMDELFLVVELDDFLYLVL